MEGYILYQTYRTENKKTIIELFGRLDDGRSFVILEDRFKPGFYIKKNDVKLAKEICSFAEYDESIDLKNFEDEKLVLVKFNEFNLLKEINRLFLDNNIITYENDVNPVQQFLFFKKILRTIDVNGNEMDDEFCDVKFINPETKPSEEKIPKLKLLSIDIETSMDVKKLYSISLYSNDKYNKYNEYKKVLIINDDNKLKDAECVNSEKELLVRFKKEVKNFDPDLILGWNVIDFDFNVLKKFCRKNNVSYIFGRMHEECVLRLNSDFFRDSTSDFKGRLLLDGIHLLKSNFISLSDYKLSTASSEILGDKKLIDSEKIGTEIEDSYINDPQKLIDYNLKDSKLVLDIIEKTDVLNISMQRTLLTGLSLERIKASIASLDNLYIRELRERGYVAYSKSFKSKEEKTIGGYVKESKPGIYDYVLVLDFKSLYPSIIRTFNIDPLSFVEEGKKLSDKIDIVEAPNGAKFRNEEGILSIIIQRLWKKRDAAKKRKDIAASYAIKILMNSFYGVLANVNCRFFNTKISNAITYFGQHLIKMTSLEVEKFGYKVLYGDTDSIFVLSGKKDFKSAYDIGVRIQDHINDFFKKHVEEKYERLNMMELEFEKVFKKLLFPKIRGSDEGSKKRYAGLIEKKNGDENIDFTGLEFVRSDWTKLAKNFQLNLYDKVFHDKKIDDYIKKFVKDVFDGKYDDELVYRKSLRKPLEEYVKTTPPHVKAARLLDKIESNIIKYVITVDGPQPIQKIKSKIDYDHYIEKQIKPIADAVLIFFDKTFDDLVAGSVQKGLFDY